MKKSSLRIPRRAGAYEARALVSISSGLQRRLSLLRRRLENCFRIRLDEDDLMEYLCENALERLEDWADRLPGGAPRVGPSRSSESKRPPAE